MANVYLNAEMSSIMILKIIFVILVLLIAKYAKILMDAKDAMKDSTILPMNVYQSVQST